MNRSPEPQSPRQHAALAYADLLAASQARRHAADDELLRGMFQESIRPTKLPSPRPVL